ncbi:hypothetical protein BH09BAC2_BH09BAC2_23070 [soil metagenome]
MQIAIKQIKRLPGAKLDMQSIPVIFWNLFPVIGVLFLGWKPESVFICYALETIVVGVFNIFRMLAINYYNTDGKVKKSGLMCLAMICFFILHYYFIVFIQLFFFFKDSFLYDGLLPALSSIMQDKSYLICLTVYVLVNISSFANIFIGKGLYAKQTMGRQMFEPYVRFFILQPVVMFGNFLFAITGNGYPVLIIFVAIKMVLDLFTTNVEISGYHYRNIPGKNINNGV